LQQQQAVMQQTPFFCSWNGINCNDTLFSLASNCSNPKGSTGITRIEIVNNNLSGNLSSRGFMDSMQLLHDCGLRRLILGGGYGELRGTLGQEWGRLYRMRGLGLFTTNLTGQLPDAVGNLTGAKQRQWQQQLLVKPGFERQQHRRALLCCCLGCMAGAARRSAAAAKGACCHRWQREEV
jgi:hypothetical protein